MAFQSDKWHNTGKKSLGRGSERAEPNPEAESQHHWFSTGNKLKIQHSWGEEYSGESLVTNRVLGFVGCSIKEVGMLIDYQDCSGLD